MYLHQIFFMCFYFLGWTRSLWSEFWYSCRWVCKLPWKCCRLS